MRIAQLVRLKMQASTMMQRSLLLTAVFWAASLQAPCEVDGRPPCDCQSATTPSTATGIRAQATREDSEFYYIDDMAFRKSSIADDKASPAENLDLQFWPGGIIFYVIDSLFDPSYRGTIVEAMMNIQSSVGINHLEFREARTPSGKICRKSYLYIERNEKGECFAEIGRQPVGLTHVWLNERACKSGTIMHEVLHALGRFHEQCRPDRDSHVILLQASIIKDYCSNFDKVPQFKVPVDRNGKVVPYDAKSIMHYGSCYFSCNGNYTMLNRDGTVIVPNRNYLTISDIVTMRLMYPTDAKEPYTDSFCKDAGPLHVCSFSAPVLSIILSVAVYLLP